MTIWHRTAEKQGSRCSRLVRFIDGVVQALEPDVEQVLVEKDFASQFSSFLLAGFQGTAAQFASQHLVTNSEGFKLDLVDDGVTNGTNGIGIKTVTKHINGTWTTIRRGLNRLGDIRPFL